MSTCWFSVARNTLELVVLSLLKLWKMHSTLALVQVRWLHNNLSCIEHVHELWPRSQSIVLFVLPSTLMRCAGSIQHTGGLEWYRPLAIHNGHRIAWRIWGGKTVFDGRRFLQTLCFPSLCLLKATAHWRLIRKHFLTHLPSVFILLLLAGLLALFLCSGQ